MEIDKLKNLLSDSIIILRRNGIIDNPFQVALIEYDLESSINKYLLCPHELDGKVIISLHPLIGFYNSDFKTKSLKKISTILSDSDDIYLTCKNHFDKNNETEVISFLYEHLKKLHFEEPVTKDLFQHCLKNNQSSHFDELALNDKYTKKIDRFYQKDWELGCKLEKVLFNTGINGYYSNTFFFNQENETKVILIGCFTNDELKAEKISELILSVLDKNNVTDLKAKFSLKESRKYHSIIFHPQYSTIAKICTGSKDDKLIKKCDEIFKIVEKIRKDNKLDETNVLDLLNNMYDPESDIDELIKSFK